MNTTGNSRGFTLIQLCVTVAIGAVVATMTAVAGSYAKKCADEGLARAQVAGLTLALERYEAKRGQAPRDLDGNGTTSTTEIIGQLKDWGALKRDFSGKDPWGNQYVVILRRDYSDNPYALRTASHGYYNDEATGFQVFSWGPTYIPPFLLGPPMMGGDSPSSGVAPKDVIANFSA